MPTTLPGLLRPKRDEIIARFIAHTLADRVGFYAPMDPTQLRARVERLIE